MKNVQKKDTKNKIYSIDVSFHSKNRIEDKEYFRDLLLQIIYHWQINEQIISEYMVFDETDFCMSTNLLIPFIDSLDEKYDTYKLSTLKKKLTENFNSYIEISHIKHISTSEFMFFSGNVNSLILYGFGTYPLLSGDNYTFIPLYKIFKEKKQEKLLDRIFHWKEIIGGYYNLLEEIPESERKRVASILHDANSFINKIGRELCLEIEIILKLPTYYYLFNYRKISFKNDISRKCPVTGNEWYIDGSDMNSFIGFKSEKARLVSNISSNC